MHFDVKSRTIYKVRHGSFAYGTNVEGSDEDYKGICVKSKECYFGFLKKFEQHELMASKNEGVDEVIYSLDKFASLAAEANPNIIEVLFVDESDVLYCNSFGRELLNIRDKFLSKKAKHTFAGYAHAQLKRIKTHRSWLLTPPKEPPSRKDFGLPEMTKISKSNLNIIESISESVVEIMPPELVEFYLREKQYQNMKSQWTQYLNWKETRNPARAELEAKYGYDVKHANHLIRLMRMCKEILRDGKVIVKRPDFEDLLAIRRGERSYESIIEEAERLESECNELYVTSNVLPKEPDREYLDKFIVKLTESYFQMEKIHMEI